MAARRAARAAARAAARSECDLDRPGRPERSRADPAGEDVTELDSIPAGRINQEGPYRITVFRAAAGRALGEPEFLTVAREILDYVLREMTSPEGGFYSTQDADSEGEEGKFFVWTPEETRAVLGEELSAI